MIGSIRFVRRGVLVATMVAGLALGRPARASHYDLGEVDVVPASLVPKLRAEGIRTTAELLERGSAPAGRHELARRLGVPARTVRAWVDTADLLRLGGVGPEMARLLTAAGAPTVALLQRQEPARLEEAVTRANARAKITPNLPSREHLRGWIERARALPLVVR